MLEVEITVSIGRYACKIDQQFEDGREQYVVEVLQIENFTDQKILYSGGFILVFNPKTNRLVDPPRVKGDPPEGCYWKEIKEQVARHIFENR